MGVQRGVGGGLVGVDVQTSSTDLAALECGKQSGLVNVGAAGGIDDAHAVLHLCDALCVNQCAAVNCRGMDGDEVGLGKQFVHLDIGTMPRVLPCSSMPLP